MGMIDEGRVFVDRRDAGFEVAKLLEDNYKDKNALVLGIPRGGVVIAYEIANLLHGELAVVVTKKLPHPDQQELAIGAAAEDGSLYLTAYSGRVNHDTIQHIIDIQLKEIQRHVERFRNGAALPDMTDRIVIIADDGIATGATLVPAIKLCRNKQAAKIIVAAPVSGTTYVPEIDALADEVVVVERPNDFYAVGQVYEDFHHLDDDEVISLIHDFERAKYGTTIGQATSHRDENAQG